METNTDSVNNNNETRRLNMTIEELRHIISQREEELTTLRDFSNIEKETFIEEQNNKIDIAVKDAVEKVMIEKNNIENQRNVLQKQIMEMEKTTKKTTLIKSNENDNSKENLNICYKKSGYEVAIMDQLIY